MTNPRKPQLRAWRPVWSRLPPSLTLVLQVVRARPLGITALTAATVGLAASDWSRHRLLNLYWYDHPIMANGVVALYFALLATVVVRTWTEVRDLERHRRVKNLGYKSVIQDIRDWRDCLVMAITGAFPVDPPPRQAADYLAEITAALVHIRFNTISFSNGFQRKRLDALLQHEVWVSAAYRMIYNLRIDATSTLAPLSSLVLSSPAVSRDLAHVGFLIDAVEDLQRPLQPVHRVQGVIPDKQRRDALIELWGSLLLTAVVLEEFLVAKFRGVGSWSSAARLFVPPELFEALSAKTPQVLKPGHPKMLAGAEGLLGQARESVRGQHPSSYEVLKGQMASGRN